MKSARPYRVIADSSAATAPSTLNGGAFSGFTEQLSTPLLGVKALQAVRINFVNPMPQLNDASQLVFHYYRANASAGIVSCASLRAVRLHPSYFVPAAAFTAYTRNRCF